MGYIYFCQNKINGHGYVGQTRRSLWERKKLAFEV